MTYQVLIFVAIDKRNVVFFVRLLEKTTRQHDIMHSFTSRQEDGCNRQQKEADHDANNFWKKYN